MNCEQAAQIGIGIHEVIYPLLRSTQVVLMLVSMIFSLPLQWGPAFELDHLELFAGDCSVTLGEFKET